MIQGKKFIYLLVALPCLLLLSLRPETGGSISFPRVADRLLENASVSAGPGGKAVYMIKDLTYRGTSDPFITDIVLSFNTPPARLLRDDTGHYRIPRRDYNFVTGRGTLGSGGAEFFKRGQGITVQTVKNAWLGTCDDLGSFTIEFRFMPYDLHDGSTLLSRVGHFSGVRRGIEIFFAGGRIVAGLYGIFDRPGRKSHDVIMSGGRSITKMKWHHFSLSFDRMSGKLVKSLDGQEDEVVYVTEGGEPFNGVYAPSFGYRAGDGRLRCVDAPPALIGADYSGLLDEFRISYRQIEELEERTALAYRTYHSTGMIGRIPFNVEGVVTSPVYRFEGTGTKVTEFRWKDELPRDTFIWMEFRIYDRLFREGDRTLKWYRIINGQKKIYLVRTESGEYLRGKYYQWRAHLISSPEGARSPRLTEIELDYRPDPPPAVPRFLEATAGEDGSIILTWRKNRDHDILGYRIYYGTRRGVYDGIISVVNGSRITNDITSGDSIRIPVTDLVIEENRSLDTTGKLTFPLLNNTVLYYFAVSAYDSYRPDTPYNHESSLPAPVTARPFAGSEIQTR